jgi:hypothetical protein
MQSPKKHSNLQKKPDYLEKKITGKSPMRCDLIFLDKDLEFSFGEFLSNFQHLFLRLLLGSLLILSILIFILNPWGINYEDSHEVAIIIAEVLLVLGISIVLFVWRSFSYPQEAIIGVLTCASICFVELSRRHHSDWNKTTYGMTAMLMEVYLLVPMISRCHWKYNSLFVFLITNYCNFRFTPIEENLSLKGYPAFVYLSNFFFVTIGSFINERFDRLLFHQRKHDENSLDQYQHLLKKVLPCSIIIFTKGRVVFYNQETYRMLNVGFGIKIEEKLRTLFIREVKDPNLILESYPDRSLINNDFYSSAQNKKETEDVKLFTGSSNSSENLYEFLLEKSKTKRYLCGFESLKGFLMEEPLMQGEVNTDNEKFLDIKICNLMWEGSDSLVVIIAEDLLTQRMKYLTEQARYKDKLLATVSHDLRTPLNGVIGILEVLLETVTEAGLKKRYV